MASIRSGINRLFPWTKKSRIMKVAVSASEGEASWDRGLGLDDAAVAKSNVDTTRKAHAMNARHSRLPQCLTPTPIGAKNRRSYSAIPFHAPSRGWRNRSASRSRSEEHTSELQSLR